MKAKKIWIARGWGEVYATFRDKSGEYECIYTNSDDDDMNGHAVEYKEYILIEVEQDD